MIEIQTSRIFIVTEVLEVSEVPQLKNNRMILIEHKKESKKESKNNQPTYTKKTVKYFIPAFYI